MSEIIHTTKVHLNEDVTIAVGDYSVEFDNQNTRVVIHNRYEIPIEVTATAFRDAIAKLYEDTVADQVIDKLANE